MASKVTTPRNPLCPLALTLDDVGPGVGYLSCYLGLSGGLKEGTFTSKPFTRKAGTQPYDVQAVYTDDVPEVTYPGGLSLSFLGIVPQDSPSLSGWSASYITIANTPESRREFASWLREQKDSRMFKRLFEKVCSAYPDDIV